VISCIALIFGLKHFNLNPWDKMGIHEKCMRYSLLSFKVKWLRGKGTSKHLRVEGTDLKY